jgi:hypothetical protein
VAVLRNLGINHANISHSRLFFLERRYDMSTSGLYHMQGTVGFAQVGAISYIKKEIHYSLIPQPKMIRCPCCGSTTVVTRGSV